MPSSPSSEHPNPFGSPTLSEEPAVPLGLTFSFPVEQTALNAGKILTWTKGFSAKNAIGNDVVQLLQDAFDRKHLHVKCVALVNDVRVFSVIFAPSTDFHRLLEPCSPARTPVEVASSVSSSISPVANRCVVIDVPCYYREYLWYWYQRRIC